MDRIGVRIREERLRLNLSQTEMGEIAGVTKNTQRLYESDQRLPKADYLASAARAGIDTQYVLTGEHSSPIACPKESFGSLQNACAVPIYDIEAAAGTGRLFDAELIETHIHFDTEQLTQDGLDPGQVVGVRVRGDSMADTLADGDRVLVNRASRTPDGVFLLRMEEGLRIKRVQRVAGGGWRLISDNAHYPPELVDPVEAQRIEIVGECWVRIGRIS